MKLFFSFVFFISTLIIKGQTIPYDSLILGNWELIAHSKTPKKFVDKNKRYLQFLKGGMFEFSYTNYLNKIEKFTGKWEIRGKELILKNDINDNEFSNYRLYLLNKTTLVIDEVFYSEELAKSTYKRIK